MVGCWDAGILGHWIQGRSPGHADLQTRAPLLLRLASPDSYRTHTRASSDALEPVIESIEFLSAEDKRKVFEGNAKKLYARGFPG